MLIRHVSRFVVVGFINTGVYYGLYLLLHMFIPYLAAHLTAFLVAMVGSFFINTHWTFQTKLTWRKFAAFPITNLANYVFTTFGVVLLVETFHIDERIAPLVVAGAAFPISFVLSRRILID